MKAKLKLRQCWLAVFFIGPISAALSCLVCSLPEKNLRGLLSRTAAGDRAYLFHGGRIYGTVPCVSICEAFLLLLSLPFPSKFWKYMLDFPLILRMEFRKLPVDRIHAQSSKFAMVLENKATGDSELNDSHASILQILYSCQC